MSANDWRVTTVGTLCDEGALRTQTGPFGSQLHSYDYVTLGVPVIPTEGIGRRRLLTKGIPQVAEETAARLSRHRLRAGDILFARRGVQATGLSALVTEDEEGWLCGTGAILLRNESDEIDSEFLSFLLSAEETITWLKRHAVGAVMPNLNEGIIRQIPIALPHVQTQRSISLVLGALDNKIELNSRMNSTLEAMARALFQSWFVDFDPVRAKLDGGALTGMDAATAALFPKSFVESSLGHVPSDWPIGALDDLIGSVIGGDWGETVGSEEFSVPCYCVRGADIPSLQSGGFGKLPTRFLKPSSVKKRQLADGDLIIEISGGSPTQCTGRPVLSSSEMLSQLRQPLVASNFCRILKLKSTAYSKYVYLWLRWLYDAGEMFQFETGTTGIKNFAYTIFSEKYPLLIPHVSIVAAFDRAVSPLFAQIHANAAESRTLGSLGDILLPKLLSGELRIPVSN